MSNQLAVDAVFDALGEPVRRTILELLTAGPQPVGRLAEQLPVGRPAVSKHLRVLSRAGLVRHDSAGTRNLYALVPDGVLAAQQWLATTWDVVLGSTPSQSATPPGNREPTARPPDPRPASRSRRRKRHRRTRA